MIKNNKRNAKLSLSAESVRLLTRGLDTVTGGQKPQNWTGTTGNCTRDIFCPTASGVC